MGELRTVARVGDLEIDLLARCVRSCGNEIRLTSLEQALLCLLAANTGGVTTKDQILDALWGADFATDTNVVERLVSNLRGKLREGLGRPRYVETVRGKGYRLRIEFQAREP